MIETPQKILDTAERLFAEEGYGTTSLRHIIAEAGVNLAAIHYHFGSKEDLLDQLIMRKAEPVNQERLALLDRFEAEATGAAVPVEKVLESFLGPPLQRLGTSPQFARLMGRMYGEGLMPIIVEKHFHTVVSRFFTALQRALPHLTHDQLAVRGQFMIGAMSHSMFAWRTGTATAGAPPALEPAALLREMIAFLSAGLRAPAVAETMEEK